MATQPAVEIFSHDPEVLALQAMIKAMRHFGGKMTMRHLKVLLSVRLCLKVTNRPAGIKQIESFSGIKEKDFKRELAELVEMRYLHVEHSKYGDLTPFYKLGAMGGTAMHHMFKHLPPLPADNDV